VDRLVLLGDAVELRHGPLHAALDAARPFFEDVGEAMAGREVVLVPGNHDHELIAPWLERRRFAGGAPALGLEERIPASAGAATAAIDGWLGAAELSIAYPGIRLRPDVYAIHGHYLDVHLTVPTVERLGAALMERVVRDGARGAVATPDAYEARLAPIYAWLHAVAQHAGGRTAAGGAEVSAKVWHGLGGGGHWGLGTRLLAGALIPALVFGANRAGLGPFTADLSGAQLRRAGLRAIGTVASGLRFDAAHVIFGHTHRAGPFPDDDAGEWLVPGGGRLVNTGSWVYQPHFVTPVPGESPYWPGTAVRLGDEGPPELVRLLGDRAHAELDAPSGSAARAGQAARRPGPA